MVNPATRQALLSYWTYKSNPIKNESDEALLLVSEEVDLDWLSQAIPDVPIGVGERFIYAPYCLKGHNNIFWEMLEKLTKGGNELFLNLLKEKPVFDYPCHKSVYNTETVTKYWFWLKQMSEAINGVSIPKDDDVLLIPNSPDINFAVLREIIPIPIIATLFDCIYISSKERLSEFDEKFIVQKVVY